MKRWLQLFLLTLLLVSCGTPSTPLVAPTATLIPSATALPTITSTATNTKTPEPTGTVLPKDLGPRITNADLATAGWDIFTPVNHADRIQTNRDIASGKNIVLPADISILRPVMFTVNETTDGANVQVNFIPGVNGSVRYAVSDDGVNMLVLEIVAADKDGNNFRTALTIAPQPALDESPFDQYALEAMQKIGQNLHEATLSLVIYDESALSDTVRTLLEPSPALDGLANGIVTTNTADTPIWFTNVSGN